MPSLRFNVTRPDLPPGALLRAGAFGVEREALRVTPSGQLAFTPHPPEFGDKLDHGRITVDFSESQLELITAPHPTIAATHGELAAIHDEVEDVLDARGERLWPFSMPPALPADPEIPVARFGPSPAGQEHELYRIGLGHRYGRQRQMISGIHFSFSFAPALLEALGQGDGRSPAERRDAAYLRTARNVLRDRWLLIYLTGASPAADPSFDAVVGSHLDAVRACCPACCAQLAGVHREAISLRMSRHGYADTAAGPIPVSFNSRSEYVADLRRLLATRSPRFAELDARHPGVRVQLNDRVLQRENEFYAPIRLKGRLTPGHTHLDAIEREGVHYAEVRLLDIDPFVREGIDATTLHFLHAFLLDALLGSDAPLSVAEWELARENHHRAALAGRQPGLRLRTAQGDVPLATLGRPILARLGVLASRLDEDDPEQPYTRAIAAMSARLTEASELPSARIHDALVRRQLTHAAYGAHLLAPATTHAFAAA